MQFPNLRIDDMNFRPVKSFDFLIIFLMDLKLKYKKYNIHFHYQLHDR